MYSGNELAAWFAGRVVIYLLIAFGTGVGFMAFAILLVMAVA